MNIFCCYCGRIIKFPLKITSEHLIPVSKGGNNTRFNKRTCCHWCNSWRGNKSFKAFRYDVWAATKNKLKSNKYSQQDLETMLYNIDYIEVYIESAGEKLFKNIKHFGTK